jgi:3-oxoacyl-(acyl-carrier-protein) synthase
MEPKRAPEPERVCRPQRRAILLMLVKDERRMARFAQYAMVASEEALNDAGWMPKKEDDLEATVCTLSVSKCASCSHRFRVSTWDLVSVA